MRRVWYLAVAMLLTLQAIVFARVVMTGERFAAIPGGAYLLALVGALIYLLAIASLTVWRGKPRFIRWGSIGAAIAISLRFYSPAVFAMVLPRIPYPVEHMAVNISPSLEIYLRELAAAEEQYRIREHSYTSDATKLSPWAHQPTGSTIEIAVRGDTGWSARASLNGATCDIWARDSLLRQRAADIEGSPNCGGAEIRSSHQRIRSVVVAPTREAGFTKADASGTWLEHRGDDRRSASISLDSLGRGHSWTERIGGAIRSSVAIAGNQVFVGSHGNGEIVALTLDSGKVGFRVRAPNWVHHEPAVTSDLVIFGFGNNEPSAIGPEVNGSPPSGVVAYDRVTGVEKWRRYTRGSVMASPVVKNSVVAVSTGADEALGWRLSDGAEVWRAPLPGYAPMANPVVVDSLFLIGVEPATVCALGIASGRRVYCSVLSDNNWGAGHASPAIAGDLVLQVYEEDLDGSGGGVDSRPMMLVRHLFGLPPRRYRPRPANSLREQVLVALRWRDGAEMWRARLGKGRNHAQGHIAGTPTVEGSVAFVPSPISQTVSAIDTRKGKILWSTTVKPARGSVLVAEGYVIAATADSTLTVLDVRNGAVKCRERLPERADRAGPTVSGATGVLTLVDGTIMARPLAAWLSCRV
jgi:outer membrane protein assembly factor BamB